MPAEQTSQSKVPFSLTCLMVGFIKKERGGAPSLSFVTSLEVNDRLSRCRLVLRHPRGGQLARQERVALVLALLDLAIPTSKADLNHFPVLPIEHALSVLQVGNQSIDLLSQNLNVSSYVRALLSFLVLFFGGELDEVNAEVRHGSVEEFRDDGLEGRVDHAMVTLLCVMLQLGRQLLVKAYLKVA